jgi:tRNA A-37 threonylcarbamoyl transferase component Bud32
MEPMTPDLLGRYEIRGVLGAGAMAVVYDGWDPIIGRRAAIKTIRREELDGAEAEELVERFKREAQAAGRLSHPNIVSVYEYGEYRGIAYIAMEFITGSELKTYFDRNERFPIPEVARIMTQLLSALDVAHRNGVVHRDIKPGNIYLLEDGTVKVADFGIARVESSNLTQAGMALGTPPYMSPEQFMGHTLDGRSDLFSAGVILYQFLTGERPFTGTQASTIMHKILQVEPPPPSVLNVQVPHAFDAVLRKALAKRPDDRYATAREFSDALNAAVAGRATEPPPIAMPDGDVERTRVAKAAAPVPAPAARSKGAVIGIGVAAVVGLAALGLGVWLSKQLPARSSPPAAVAAKEPVVPVAPVAMAAPKPFDPVNALERVFDARDRDHLVNVVPDKPRVRIGKDRLRFRVASGKPGYVYVLMVGTDKANFNLLFPNAVDGENRIAAGEELELPRPGWAMTAGGPKGADHFVAIVSENPRDFTSAGLRKVDPFGEFPLDIAAGLAARAGNAPLFAGTPACKTPGPCPARYGAAIFSVEEVD